MRNFYTGCIKPVNTLFFLKMKLTLFLIVLSATMASAESITGQSMDKVKVTIAVREVTMKRVLQLIEAQSSLSIGYDLSVIPSESKISYSASGKPVSEVLHELLKTFPVNIVQVNDKYVLIQPDGSQQQVKITGRITDRTTHEPLPGVSISIKGTGAGTQSDVDGRFALNFPASKEDLTLSVYLLGFKKKELPLTRANCTGLQISLEEDRLGLDEVVVTGQGIDISKRRLSSTVVSIGSRELEDVPATRIDQLLQSKLPNAQIRLTGGQSGATSIIRARGVNSAFVNSTPIIYVDGVRMDNLNTVTALGGGSAQGAAISSLADIPMDNIDKIEYINGGAATTMYGSDAANGVIQIFTKKGGAGKTSVTAETQMGVETPTGDFLHFKRTKELLMQNGFYQKQHIGLNGGQDNFGYSFSANYLNSQGTELFNQNNNRKVDFSTGFHAGLSDKVTYESSFTYVNNKYKRNRNGNQGGYTGLWFAESGASAITGPKFDPNIDNLSDSAFQRMKDYVREAERLQDNDITVNRFQTSQSFKYRPLKNLVFKATGGIDYRVMKNQVITTNQYLSFTTNTQVKDQGSINNNDRKYLGITLELNGQYEAKVNDFSFVTTAGTQFFRNEDQQIAYNGSNIRDGAKNIKDAATKTSDEFYLEAVNYGVYIQENIGFKNKLFLDFGIRGDGNPAFGKNIGIQYYPKVGFSYIPSAEPWFSGLSQVITSAKVKGGYGIAGNLPTPFANERTIAFQGYNSDQAAFFGQPGNDNLRPEKTQTTEGSVDLGFLKDRLLISAGYYNSITTHALFYVPPTPSTGQSLSQLYNVGKILNKGWEFSITGVPVETKNITLRLNASVNTLYNNVEDAGGVPPFNINGFSARTIQTVVEQGHPVGYLRGNYGVFGPDGTLQSTVAQQSLGTTIPNLFGSMGLNFRYKQLNFFANADYQKGAYANSFDRQFRFNYGAGNEGIPQAEIDKNKRTNWLNFTNMFTEKTDFIKVRMIGVTYSWKPAMFRKVVKSANVGFSAMNPFNFAASSFDPEATISGSAQGQGGATTGGISYATYSAPRQFLGTLRLNF
ncbi:TonB-dependent receptor domain-containing protein [Chitinophaga arvensicola]|uniref:Outer membrane receptor proteins, mostly Fe transport n=1 Tax=Chitinophaga arvensicola TaxID=29529 RepID=A0A1I0RT41_9BACT|nr:TonB-dependent receptor [Chitinophaga arvensicola]SEW43991.1 Outer membrane receptor proteins, mostly Fe transport [Chitinophaga arvensicola]